MQTLTLKRNPDLSWCFFLADEYKKKAVEITGRMEYLWLAMVFGHTPKTSDQFAEAETYCQTLPGHIDIDDMDTPPLIYAALCMLGLQRSGPHIQENCWELYTRAAGFGTV